MVKGGGYVVEGRTRYPKWHARQKRTRIHCGMLSWTHEQNIFFVVFLTNEVPVQKGKKFEQTKKKKKTKLPLFLSSNPCSLSNGEILDAIVGSDYRVVLDIDDASRLWFQVIFCFPKSISTTIEIKRNEKKKKRDSKTWKSSVAQ
jgi:hypothetical protein